jgi:hypothetical protein
MTAPTCLIQPTIKIEQPDPRTAPSIPRAHDLDSAIRAINAIADYLRWLNNMLSQNNHRPNPSGGGGSTNSKKNSNKVGKYTEVSRSTKTVRIYNPNDKSQYVDVEQIYALNFQDNKTGETWTWKR